MAAEKPDFIEESKQRHHGPDTPMVSI